MRGLSPVVASVGHSSSRCAGLSPSRPLLLRSTDCRRAGSVVVGHGPSCSAACGIFPDQGSNPCPLHWQADSQPPRHQGSPIFPLLEWCPTFILFSSYCSHSLIQSIILIPTSRVILMVFACLQLRALCLDVGKSLIPACGINLQIYFVSLDSLPSSKSTR